MLLAGISISALTNQGLFTQAQNAKNLTEEKTAEENEILTNYLEQMNAIIGGQVTETTPDGAVVTPVNDITTWLKTGEISKQYSYTTIEQVIADSTCTESLMNNENAMKYLARSTEFADAICASETTMTYLGQSAYVDDTVLNSSIWVETICNNYYMEKIFTPLIPTMTSNNSPSGIASSNMSNRLNDAFPYYAFDKNENTEFYTTSSFPGYLQYEFPYNVDIYAIKMIYNDARTQMGQNMIIQYSTDCTQFNVLIENQYYNAYKGNVYIKSSKCENVKALRWYMPSGSDGESHHHEYQVYGRLSD